MPRSRATNAGWEEVGPPQAQGGDDVACPAARPAVQEDPAVVARRDAQAGTVILVGRAEGEIAARGTPQAFEDAKGEDVVEVHAPCSVSALGLGLVEHPDRL